MDAATQTRTAATARTGGDSKDSQHQGFVSAAPQIKRARPTGFMLAFYYILFAATSTAANLIVQEAVTQILPVANLLPALMAGTGVGFLVKYILDKRFIFHDPISNAGAEARKVSLSALFSVFTTLVFWGFEIAFWLIWGTSLAKYAGAIIGISIGYIMKYTLDRRFVFKPSL